MPGPDSQFKRHTLLQGLAVAAGCWVLLSALYLTRATETFDLKLLDWRFRIRGERPASESIALVGVDDATIAAYGVWPLARDAHALLLTAIAEAGASAIGVDFQFPSDANQDPRHDALLATVSSVHPTIVHALVCYADAPDSGRAALAPDVEEAVRRQGLAATDVRAPEAEEIAAPYPELALLARAMGHTNVSIDPDGAVRRVPFFIRQGGRVYPALSLRVIGIARGAEGLPEVRGTRDGAVVRWPGAGALDLPMDEDGATRLDFAGDQGSFPRVHSMLEVLRWYRMGDLARLRAAFEGRIVLVGLTSRREATEDIGPTPFSTATPLLFVHANAIDCCLKQAFIRPIPVWAYLALLGLLSALFGWLYSILRVPGAATLAVGGMAALAGADQAVFSLGRWDLAPSLLIALPVVCYAAIESTRYLFLERRSREREEEIRQGRSVQQQFLPEAVVGHTLSHYKITAPLGRGGMGIVYRGVDTRLGRTVAIKVLPGAALADETARRRFHREARILSKLTHPHVARLYEVDSQDGMEYLVMEFVDGKTLADLIERGPLPEGEALRLGSQITEAVGDAHRLGIVHRDLKPSNVMVTRAGDVKILDFGLARILEATAESTTTTGGLTETGVALGTLPYMAPEVLQGRGADARTDIYGIGMLVYEMTTARRPYLDDTPHELIYTILNQEPPEPRVLNRGISPALERVILKALAKSPGARQQSADEILAELRSAGASAGVS